MLKTWTLFVLAAFVSGCHGLYSESDDVQMLSADDFRKNVEDKKEVWMVEFFSPRCPHCVSMVPAFKQAATTLKGIFKVGAVDISVHSALGNKYATKGVPTVLLFNVGDEPISYEGARQANDFVEFFQNSVNAVIKRRLGGKKEAGGSAVVELTDSNFDSEMESKKDAFWLVEFYAPWCGHCKNLAPEWAKAAERLKGDAILAAVDATVHHKVTARFNIQGFPTIKVFLPNDHSNPKEYEGPRSADGIEEWVRQRLADQGPAPKIIELVSQQEFDAACSRPVCVISFLPHLLDCQSKCRNDYLNMLQEVADEFKRNQWGWIWTEGMIHPDLEESVGVGGFGYPAMVAMNVKKNVYTILKGAFTKQGITGFLKEIAYGRGSTITLTSKVPKINTTEPWNGKDFEYEGSEELEDEKIHAKEEL